MMKEISEVYASAKLRGKPLFTFEIFPPRGDMSVDQAAEVVDRLADLYPDFVSVTFSAGGCGSHGRAADTTTAIAELIQRDYQIPALAHLTCASTTRDNIDTICDDMKSRGIQNVLALRGDLREGEQPKDFSLAIDLISYLKDKGFCVGAAAYPEGHVNVIDPKENIAHLKAKYEAGADFFVTQLCFQNSLLYQFWEDARAAGVEAPISFGIMPFLSKSQLERMVFMCGVSLPGAIVKLLARYEGDDAALRAAGIEYAARQISDLATHGVDGVHLYTMNHPDIARTVKADLDIALRVRA